MGPSSLDSQESNHANFEDPLKHEETTAVNHNHTLPSPVEEEINSMLGGLSGEERQLLEEENIHLYKELMSNQEEVKQITRQVKSCKLIIYLSWECRPFWILSEDIFQNNLCDWKFCIIQREFFELEIMELGWMCSADTYPLGMFSTFDKEG